MLNVYFDESGNTGQNLSDLSQPTFALSSTILDPAAAVLVLSRFARLGHDEIKYSKVRRTERGQQLALEFLQDGELSGKVARVFVVHKPFMIVSKMVDMLIEPVMHRMGHNMYEQKEALALANLLTLTYPVFIGRTRFDRLLSLFVEAVRTKDKAISQRFFKEAEALDAAIEKKHPKCGDLLLPLKMEAMEGAPHVQSASFDELDPIIATFMNHVRHWRGINTQRMGIVADESKTLRRNEQMFMDLSNQTVGSVSKEYYGHRLEFPLPIDSFRFVDSRHEPSVRVADLLAGIAVDAFAPLVRRESPTDYQRKLQEALFGRELVLGALWPSDDVTPEALEAEAPQGVDPAAVVSEFLHRVRTK